MLITNYVGCLFLYTDIIHNPTVPSTTTFIIYKCQLAAVDILVLPQIAKVKFISVAIIVMV